MSADEPRMTVPYIRNVASRTKQVADARTRKRAADADEQ
jgi:hypothetical protein